MPITTDRDNPDLNKVDPSNGQNAAYLVLSEEERAKGFVRPVRCSYVHVGKRPTNPLRDLTEKEQQDHAGFGYVKYEEYPESELPVVGRFWTREQLVSCGCVTTMGRALGETYARDPKFYGATWCMACRKHLPVDEFVWDGTDERVGS